MPPGLSVCQGIFVISDFRFGKQTIKTHKTHAGKFSESLAAGATENGAAPLTPAKCVLDSPFIIAVVVATWLFALVSISGGSSTSTRIAVILSVPPVFCVVYLRMIILKGWLLHREDLFERPITGLQRRETPWPCLAFVIASYDEPFAVAKMTFDCAYRSKYRGAREIIVVDNSTNDGAVDFQRWKSYVASHAGLDSAISVTFRHNTSQPGSKAENIDLANTLIKTAEYLVFLDVDSSLPLHSDFLHEAVEKFENNSKLGVLQLHTVPTNGHFNRLGRAVATFQGVHRALAYIRSHGGFAMFYGHNAIWRRSLFDHNRPWFELYRGNLIVTEDLLKTVDLYANGFESQYMYLTTGEWVPTSLRALKSMWMRWTYGGFQVSGKYWRAILGSKGFSGFQRLDLSTFSLSYLALPLIFPMTLVWAMVFPVAIAAWLTLLVAFLPQLSYVSLYSRHHPRQFHGLRKYCDLYSALFIIEIYVSMIQMGAAINFLTGRKQGWTVTSKRHEKKRKLLTGVREDGLIVFIASSAIIYLLCLWIYRDAGAARTLPYYILLGLMPFNLLLCVIAYSDQVQEASADVDTATIDHL